MMKDYFKMAIQNLSHRKLRTFLTLIGIFIGITAVVGLVSLAQGFQNYLEDEFSQLGADKIIINPSGSTFGTGETVNPLTVKDVEVIRKSSGVSEAAYFKFNVAMIEWGREDIGFYVVYTYPFDDSRKLLEETQMLKVAEGKPLRSTDSGRVAVGWDYANSKGFGENLRIGSKITINGKDFKVAAINEKIGNPQDDRSVVMIESDYANLFQKTDEVSSIIARVQKGIAPKDVVVNIEKDLRKSRGLKEGQEDFEVETFEDLIKTFLTIFATVGFVLVGIAGISLVVGGIGIMNTMYTAVVERTKEIGIMKAIGARNEDILAIFLIESGFLGMIGGAIGIVLGMGLAKAIEFVATAYLGTDLLRAAMPWWLIVGALLFAFLLGSISGLLPARQASKMNPVDALRTE